MAKIKSKSAWIVLALTIFAFDRPRAEGEGSRAVFRPRTQAGQCAPLDARKSKPQLKKFYASRKTQDRLGWCYASAASDLLSHRLGRPVSGVDLALTYNHGLYANRFKRGLRKLGNALNITQTEGGAYEAGSIAGAVAQARKVGVCPAERIPSHINLEAERSGFELVSLLNTVRDMGKELVESGASYEDFIGSSVVFKATTGKDFDQTTCTSSSTSVDLFEEFFPGVDTRELYRLLVKQADKDVNDTLYKLAEQHCRKQRLDIGKIKVETLSTGDRERWPEIMDRQLKKGELVGIEFRTRMLFPSMTKWMDNHAVSVVARKFEGGQCKYLIRDSMANSCADYGEELRPGCDPETRNVWVPEVEIHRYMHELTYLK